MAIARYGEEMLSLVDRHDLSPMHRGIALMSLALGQTRRPAVDRSSGLRDGAELLEAAWRVGPRVVRALLAISQYALEAGDVEIAHIAAERALEAVAARGSSRHRSGRSTLPRAGCGRGGDLDVGQLDRGGRGRSGREGRGSGFGDRAGPHGAGDDRRRRVDGPASRELWVAAATHFTADGVHDRPREDLVDPCATFTLSVGNIDGAAVEPRSTRRGHGRSAV